MGAPHAPDKGDFERLIGVNRDIREAIVGDAEAKTRESRRLSLLTWATLVVTVIGVVIAAVALVVQMQTRDAVEGITAMSTQEVVDELRSGMPASELRELMEVPPVVDDIYQPPVELADGATLRRIVYEVGDHDLAVMALTDPFNNVRLFSVTTLDPSLRLTFPDGDTGTYAQSFVTGETTLAQLADRCIDGMNAFGGGAAWGYFAIGCGPYGYNNNDGNIVGVNFFGPGTDQAGLRNLDIGSEVRSGAAEMAAEVADVRMNTFAWGDFDFLVGAYDSAAFAAFVQDVEMGPGRGEPVSTTGV